MRALAGAIGAVAVGGALLFLGYLRVSWTVAATADGAAQALQARDMLAGNWLLHGWTLSDVSFYTTELPEYVVVEAIRPFGLGVIHVAAALTYTLLVLAVFALARGRAGGREGVLAGSAGGGDHAGAAARVRGVRAAAVAGSRRDPGAAAGSAGCCSTVAPRRWWVPAILCLLLAVVQFADRVAVLTAVLPLIVVVRGDLGASTPATFPGNRRAGGRMGPGLLVRAGADRGRGRLGRGRLGGGAAAGGGGRVRGHPFPLTLAPLSQLWTHAWLTGWGILELYGGNFIGVTGWVGFAFAALHLIGLTLAVAAVAVALGRFVRPPAPTACHRARGAQARRSAAPDGRRAEPDLVDSVLAVAVVANLVSYLLSTAPGTVIGTGYDAREIAAVLPLGAVLAGRVFGTALAGRVLASGPGRPRAGLS